jgi:hypothetical protein
MHAISNVNLHLAKAETAMLTEAYAPLTATWWSIL